MALMENKKQVFVLIAAVATGLIAAVFVSNFVQTTITYQTERIAGKFKKDQDMKDEANRQQIQAFQQKIAEVEERARQGEQAVARVAAAQAAKKAEEARKEKKPPALSLRMPPGKRAVTIEIDVLKAVGGLISPGDYVDIIAQLDIPSANAKDATKKDSVTAMIFQNIQVMAINGNVDQPTIYDDNQQKNTNLKITLAVAPDEASLLAFAEKNGKIELALRSPTEKKPAMISAATWSTLAEYVLENTGADIPVPPGPVVNSTGVVVESPKNRKKKAEAVLDPSILIYKAGKGAN